MSRNKKQPVDTQAVQKMLRAHAPKMKRYLRHCMRCSLCAESCFLFRSHGGDPRYMPSYKVINSLGVLYRRRGKVDRKFLEKIKTIVWHDCVLCTRCWCPVGVDIPEMIALARGICRSQGVYPTLDEQGRQESWL